MPEQETEDEEYPLDEEPGEEAGEFESPEEEASEEEDEEGNLALRMEKTDAGRKELHELGSLVCDNFQRDWDSNEEYRERVANDWSLFTGKLPSKKWPFPNSANGHVPILFENLTRIHTRMVSEIFGDWTYFMTVYPPSPQNRARAELMTMHDNHQFREEIPDFMRQQDRGVLAYCGWGDVTFHSFYDERRKQNRHEVQTCDDFVVPYTQTSTMPDYSDCPRVTKILRYYRHELEEMRGKWAYIEKIIEREPNDPEGEPEAKLAERTAADQGIALPDSNEDGVYKLLQQEGWFQLEGKLGKDSDGNKRMRFCQLIVDEQTKCVASLRIHELVDPAEKLIHDRKMAEAKQYQDAMTLYSQQLAEIEARNASAMSEAATIDQNILDGLVPMEAAPQAMMMSEQLKAQVQATIVPPIPPRPMWMDADGTMPEEPKKKPIHMFSHGVNVENMTGVMGLGQGRILADYNRAANTALSQFADAATLANVWSLITDELVEFEGDTVTFTPGKINKVKGFAGDDLRKHIMEMKGAPANPQLLELVSMFSAYGQSTMQAPEVLSGEPGKSGETFRGLNARIEQATKQLSTPTRKYANGVLKSVVRNNARLNAIYLEEQKMVSLYNWKIGQYQDITVSRSWYDEPYAFEFRTDFRFASEAQRIKEADELLQLPTAVPALQPNLAFQFETVKASLEARGRDDLVATLGQQPPPVPAMFGLPSIQPPAPPQPGAPGGPPQGPPPQ